MSSSNYTDSVIAALANLTLTQQLGEVLGKTLAQSQENNRALAAICEEIGWGVCSAGSTTMPLSMLGLIMIMSAVVLLVHLNRA